MDMELAAICLLLIFRFFLGACIGKTLKRQQPGPGSKHAKTRTKTPLVFLFVCFFSPLGGGLVGPMRLDTRGKKRKRQAPTAAPGLEPGIFCCSSITWFGRPTVRAVIIFWSSCPKTRKTSRVNRRPLSNARPLKKSRRPELNRRPFAY